ncbi:hypothetical protein [Microseira wollei]|uniref:Uncharacterized protein n=1 Tax=Microseira wollei NIES-4236 TaxID=2530354 RepID=A0AAV3XHZ7_9CYAN|nr:hypothetical protein [Microseira wollei]GET41928.1 hypothetical protein MiSe_67420 [Microseira wollei NIES-4236]
MSVFVGVSEQLLTEEELKQLLQSTSNQPNYYFLRLPHKVSGILEEFPKEFPSPEGQMFNSDRELRWKQQKPGLYNVLILSNNGETAGFTAIDGDWKTQQRAAYGYRTDETRFPRSLIFPESIDPRISGDKTKTNKPKLAQRYFIDADTSTVHFVALTVEMPQ